MKSINRYRLLFLFIAIMLIVLLGYLYQAFSQSSTPHTDEQPVFTDNIIFVMYPQLSHSTSPFIFSAKVYPIEAAEIFSRADGYVEDRFVDIGDKVKKGQLLARLSSPELEQKIIQAQAQVKQQEATVSLAKLQFDRVKILVGKGVIAKSLFDEREAAYQVSLATLELNKAQLMELKKQFEYTNITAPFDGFISVRNIERGDRISNTDATPLFRLVRIDKLRVTIDIPQALIFMFDREKPIQLSFAELPGKVFQARFSRAAGEIEQQTGTMRVEFLMDNKNNYLPAGLNGEVTINVNNNLNILLAPVNSIKIKEGKSYVLIVDNQNRIAFRTVITGRTQKNYVEILSGLTKNDRVIINPNALLAPGQKVQQIKIVNSL